VIFVPLVTATFLNHSNLADTDVLIWEGDVTDPTLKPPEMYTLIENFCLGLRRLELFGRARSLRQGWISALAEGEEASVGAEQGGDITMDEDERPVKWHREAWEAKMKEFTVQGGGKAVVPITPGMHCSLSLRLIFAHELHSTQKSTRFGLNLLSAGAPVTSPITHQHRAEVSLAVWRLPWLEVCPRGTETTSTLFLSV
jgi:hypothetical protein